MIKRLLLPKLKADFYKGRAIILIGARQTGKTTLARLLLQSLPKTSIKKFNGDDPDDVFALNQRGLAYLKRLLDAYKIIFIDEAHKIPTIGNTLKLLVDEYQSKKQFIITASSTFNLLDHTSEPLTGRKFTFTLYPCSIFELYPHADEHELAANIEPLLIYGTYPSVFLKSDPLEKEKVLKELTSSYLYRDILEFQKVRNSITLRKLLQALALQIGSEVSYLELQKLIGIDRLTVERYIDLLEKNFIVFRLPPYAKNKRRVISRMHKIYFYDLGIRNTLINNFNPLEQRNDIGALWENFLILERIKYKQYFNINTFDYFWRTYDGAELDFIEETPQRVHGYEFKWSKDDSKIKPPQSWLEDPGHTFSCINRFNFVPFLNHQLRKF